MATARTRSRIPAKNVVPDRVDLRDRPYQPRVGEAPPPHLHAFSTLKARPPLLDQGSTNACTGFALATVVNFLLARAGRSGGAPVSPFMIYSMARRYDEFPGSSKDTGSSLRGAMKGWYKHGVCAARLWTVEKMPAPALSVERDWWQDGARRPLGAYYRVEPRSPSDMHAALHDAGVLYASAICHSGWDEGFSLAPGKRKGWRIPPRKAGPADGGHAFAIVGYDEHGFLIQNSWGPEWGDDGFATLRYEDWVENAMDCWVAQLGVVTEQHVEVSKSLSLRASMEAGAVTVSLAIERELRTREISPFVIDMENNGRLSQSGEFRTQEADLRALVTTHFDAARKLWNMGSKPVDVAIYAHGGLTDEESAAETAARWIPALYEARIFPIFLMWETGLWSTLRNRLEDLITGEPRPAGGFRDEFSKWWNERLERTLAQPGSVIWDEMKQNARAMTTNKESGVQKLYEIARPLKSFEPGRLRLHLIGHSAGSIALSYIASALARRGWRFKTVSFMAPAVTVKTWKTELLPQLRSGRVERYNQFHLTDEMEAKDPTCRPILGYGRSLLYLVSESFEGGVRTPILGMEKYFEKDAEIRAAGPRIRSLAAPTSETASTTHGGFDDDQKTMRTIIDLMRNAP